MGDGRRASLLSALIIFFLFPTTSSLPVLPVGAKQPESFIGYFTTACVAIGLAIFSYILLPRMVRLCCPGGEGCGDTGPLCITAQGLWPTSTPALAATSLLLLGQDKPSLVPRELSGVLPTSDTSVSLGYCGNDPWVSRKASVSDISGRNTLPILHLSTSPISATATQPLAAFFPYT